MLSISLNSPLLRLARSSEILCVFKGWRGSSADVLVLALLLPENMPTVLPRLLPIVLPTFTTLLIIPTEVTLLKTKD